MNLQVEIFLKSRFNCTGSFINSNINLPLTWGSASTRLVAIWCHGLFKHFHPRIKSKLTYGPFLSGYWVQPDLNQTWIHGIWKSRHRWDRYLFSIILSRHEARIFAKVDQFSNGIRGHSTTTWTRRGGEGVSQKSMLVHPGRAATANFSQPRTNFIWHVVL